MDKREMSAVVHGREQIHEGDGHDGIDSILRGHIQRRGSRCCDWARQIVEIVVIENLHSDIYTCLVIFNFETTTKLNE